MGITTDNYVLKADNKQVTAYAIARIPLSPKVEWQRDFLSNLKVALSELKAQPGEELSAVYGSAQHNDFIDTENALFYNISTTVFKGSAQQAISFQTLGTVQTRQLLDKKQFPHFQHYYCYEILPIRKMALPLVLEWENVPIFSIRGEHKPFEYWRSLREHPKAISVYRNDSILGPFALDICINAPETGSLNLANPMKAMLDGVICAFHKMPASVSMENLHEISNRLGYPIEAFSKTQFPILGEEEYVKPYRNNVFWNPQDHRCKQVRLSINYGAPQWSFSGKLFTIKTEDIGTEKTAMACTTCIRHS